jgi:hypothetical protein
MAKPEPDIPIKCSAEMFDAISEAPMATKLKSLLQEKIFGFGRSSLLLFKNPNTVANYYNKIYKKY